MCDLGVVDLVQDDLSPSTVVASSTYIEALILLPNIEREGTNNGQFERGQLVQAILTKGGLRLQKSLVMTPSWAPW